MRARSAGRPAEPPLEFADACQTAGVTESERGPLWALHQRWRRPGLDQQQALGQLFEDHAHWRLYLRSRHGDLKAARRFEQHWSRYMRAYLGARFRPDQAEELGARFFERVYRLVGVEFHWRCPFGVYLRAILVNLARDEARRLGRQRRREESLDARADGGESLSPSRDPDPEHRLLASEQASRVRAALAALDPGDRHIVRVCLVEGGSGQQLAAELGIKRDALYQRLRRAKLKLRKLLEREGLSDE